MKSSERTSTRREPKQQRARQTVDAVLDAVPRVLAKYGALALTTNRVAEVAGVSIGSLYQYFPNKEAIYTALHDRHVEAVRAVIEQWFAEGAAAAVEDGTITLVERLARVHSREGELHELVSDAVPSGARGFLRALHGAFERVLAPPAQERYSAEQAERMLFVLPSMVEALVHSVARPAHPSTRERARDEAIRTVASYLRSVRAGA